LILVSELLTEEISLGGIAVMCERDAFVRNDICENREFELLENTPTPLVPLLAD
jgi:hypothetical protein